MKMQVRRLKQVILYSTFVHNPSAHAQSKKPYIVHLYNKTKFGIDIHDKMTKHFSFFPKTNRWPIRVFTWLVDTMALNAMILYKKYHGIGVNSFDVQFKKGFLRRLGDQLMEPQRTTRSQQPIQNWIYVEFKKIYDALEELHRKVKEGRDQDLPKNRECKICTGIKNSINFRQCESCQDFVCREHLHDVCKSCIEGIDQSEDLTPGPSTSEKVIFHRFRKRF